MRHDRMLVGGENIVEERIRDDLIAPLVLIDLIEQSIGHVGYERG